MLIMRTIRISIAIILFLYSIPTILSAFDIYQGTEPDLSTEWIIVSAYLILSFVFSVFTLLELFPKLKRIQFPTK